MVNKCSLRSVRWLACWLLPLKIHVKAVEQYICSMRTCCPQEFLEVAERERGCCFVLCFLKTSFSAGSVAHICNPQHWRGRGRVKGRKEKKREEEKRKKESPKAWEHVCRK